MEKEALSMDGSEKSVNWAEIKKRWPDKFASEEKIFDHIHPGNRIFIGTACGEPQHLVRALVDYIEKKPKAFFDAELVQVWSLGIAPYNDEKFKENFRLNSFFITENSRNAVNRAAADYTPIFLSSVPDLFARGIIPIDVALIQTSPPDSDGNMSLGISVDIVKAAAKAASIVVAQVNSKMPFIYGDGIINVQDVDFLLPYDEPLLEYQELVPGDIAQRIGKYVARLVEDGSTLQVGYGSIPNAVLANLADKKHLGLHSELFSDGVSELMKAGALDNSKKSIDKEKAVASFCMGTEKTYAYLHRNNAIEFRTIDYTNDLLIIARQEKMTAINSALEIDLTGQATAESLGKTFYSGIGGQADFMRGAVLAPGGKTILAMPSTAQGGQVSRIVPFLREGAGVTLSRGDVRYVVTEYGIAYLHGKSIRERAMDLIAIAHPMFRPWLVEEARKLSLIYRDQEFVPGEYPEAWETFRTTKTGLRILLRPVKISDEPLLKDLFYSLSDQSMYSRFASARKDMHHARLQEFVAVDYVNEIVILATCSQQEKEKVVGLGQYIVNETSHTAEVALVVRDDYQNQGVGTELNSYLTYLAKRQGLLGFTAEVLEDNMPALCLLENMGFNAESKEAGVYEMKLMFNKAP
jgi:acyl-CoA hydrolase/GNAT superfamily N-acetyltransferase